MAGVEVGNLMADPTPLELKPLDFSEDHHSLLSLGDRLLLATASGIYVTDDLVRFELKTQGYAHALAPATDAVVAHMMSERPILVFRDRGRLGATWGSSCRPTFGTTGLLCEGDACIYSTTETYRVDLRSGEAVRVSGPHPMASKIVKL